MNKTFYSALLIALAAIYSASCYASEGEGRGHARAHHKKHHEKNYPEHARTPSYRDPRSHQGLAGGVVGSVVGYELGNGNPVATGLGAAAGSYIGNGIAERR